MNLHELKIKIAEVLGVSDSEKELAFDVFTYQTFFVLDEEETLKVPDVGFFQYKKRPFKIGDKMISGENAASGNTLVFAPLSEDLSSGSYSLFLTIDIPHQKKDLFELDESVFSIGVGKPILPIAKDSTGKNNTETSYALLKKSIEERVGEIISDSEHLTNFDIWEDYLSNIDLDSVKSVPKSSSTLHKLTDDIDYSEDDISPNMDEPEDYKFPDVDDIPDADDDLSKLESELEDFSALENYDEDLSKPEQLPEETETIRIKPNTFHDETDSADEELEHVENESESFDEEPGLVDEDPEDVYENLEHFEEESEPVEEEPEDVKEPISIDDHFEEEPETEEKLVDEKIEVPVVPLSRKTKEDKFWGMEDFKTTSEKHTEEDEGPDEDDENIDWDWGDDLLNKDDAGAIDVNEFEKSVGEDDELEEIDEKLTTQSEERNTNLFVKLEKSLSGVPEEDELVEDDSDEEAVDDEVIAAPTKRMRETSMKNVIYEADKVERNYGSDDDGFKAKFLKNSTIIFGALAVLIILIMIFVVPGEDKPTQQSTNIAPENQSSDVVTRESSTGEIQQGAEAAQNIPDNLDENPIEERTRQMQESSNITPTTTDKPKQEITTNKPAQTATNIPVNDNGLYRNIPNESTVRGLIFTDGSKYYVQVSSWPISDKAETEARRLRGLGYDAFIVKAYIQKYRSTWYRVKIGSFNSVYEADRFLQNNKF